MYFVAEQIVQNVLSNIDINTSLLLLAGKGDIATSIQTFDRRQRLMGGPRKSNPSHLHGGASLAIGSIEINWQVGV